VNCENQTVSIENDETEVPFNLFVKLDYFPGQGREGF